MENGVTKETAKQFVTGHRQEVCDKADILLTEVLPLKISHLHNLSQGSRFSWDNIDKVRDYSYCDGKIVTNKIIQENIAILKPYLREFIDHTVLLRTWITLLVPKTEDGDNLGVQIQYQVMDECDSNGISVKNFYYSFSEYYASRTKLISKLEKYPGAEDSIKSSIQEYDEAYFLTIRVVAHKLYYYYLSMNDTIRKNMDKIRKPKNDSHELCLY